MADWKVLADRILNDGAQEYFAEDPVTASAVKAGRMSRLVVSLPFISGCARPEDVAKRNLDMLLGEEKSPGKYAHKSGMSLRQRLSPGDIVPLASDKGAAEKGMLLLELASLQDHQRDQVKDKNAGTPNPLNEGMDYQTERRRLETAIAGIAAPEVDRIATAAQITAAPPPQTMAGSVMDVWFY